MRAFSLLGLIIVLFGCGDEETPLPIEPPEPKIEYLPVPVDQPPAVEFFAPFKDTLTDEEFEHLLESVVANCKEDNVFGGTLRWRLRSGLSEKALARVFSNDDKFGHIKRHI